MYAKINVPVIHNFLVAAHTRNYQYWVLWCRDSRVGMKKDLWKLAVPPLVCYFLGLSLTLPLAAQVVVKLVCEFDSDHGVNDDDCSSKSIAQKAGWIVTSMFVASSLPSVIMNGNYGRMSDLYGRKYIAIIPFIGTLIYVLTLIYVSLFRPAQYIPILLISAFINGFCGIYSVVTMGLFTFAADVLSVPGRSSDINGRQVSRSVSLSSDEDDDDTDRTAPDPAETAFAFSMMEGAISFTRLVGPTLGGLLTAEVDHSFVLALTVAAVFTALGGLWVGLVLPAVSVPGGAGGAAPRPPREPSAVRGGEEHFLRHTEASPDSESGTQSPADTFKFNFLVTFQNIYWLVMIVPTLIPSGGAPDPAVKHEDTSGSGLWDKHNQHQKSVIVHLKAVPYFAIGYFFYFTALIALEAVLLVIFLIHVYDFGPAAIGYFVTCEAAAQTISILLVPLIVQSYVIPAINRAYACLQDSASASGYSEVGVTADSVHDPAPPVSAPELLIPLFSDIDLICIGHFARAVFLIALGAYLHYDSVSLFLLLILLVPSQLVMPRTKAILSNCFSVATSFSLPVQYESLTSVSSPTDRPLLDGSDELSVEQCQSKMFSALSSLEIMGSFVAPVIGLLYAATVTVYPGVVFLLLSTLSLASGVLVYIVSVRKYYDVVPS